MKTTHHWDKMPYVYGHVQNFKGGSGKHRQYVITLDIHLVRIIPREGFESWMTVNPMIGYTWSTKEQYSQCSISDDTLGHIESRPTLKGMLHKESIVFLRWHRARFFPSHKDKYFPAYSYKLVIYCHKPDRMPHTGPYVTCIHTTSAENYKSFVLVLMLTEMFCTKPKASSSVTCDKLLLESYNRNTLVMFEITSPRKENENIHIRVHTTLCWQSLCERNPVPRNIFW